MRVWQANLGRGVPPSEFERNLCRVLEAAGPRAVVAFQEIDEADTPDEHAILLRRAGKTHTIVGFQTSVPILVPKHLPIMAQRQTIGCRGLAGFTPYRPVNEALTAIGGNLLVALLNLHVPIDRPETRSRRTECRRALRDRCHTHRSAGNAGIWLSDTNSRDGWPEIVAGERVVVDAGIDRAAAWVPPGRRLRVVVTERETVQLSIDGHDAHGARVMFEAA